MQLDEISQTPSWTDWDSAVTKIRMTTGPETTFDIRNADVRGREITGVSILKNGEEKDKHRVVLSAEGRILKFWSEKDEQRFIAGTEAECKADLPKTQMPKVTPTQRITALMEAGKQGQMQAVKAMVDIMTKGAKGFFEDMLKQDPPSDGETILTFEIVSEKIEGRRAEVKVKAKSKSAAEGAEAEEDEVTFGLKIEDGEWRLFRMREGQGEWNDFEEIARIMKEMKEKGSPDGEND